MRYLSTAALLASAMSLSAQPAAHGVLRISGHIEGSLVVVFAPQSAPSVQTNGGSAAAFSVPTIGGSFSRRPLAVAPGETSFAISEPFTVTVHKANLLSATYTLNAGLAAPDPQRVWKIDNTVLSGQMQRVSGAEPFGVPTAHSLTVSGPVTGALNFVNAVNFQITAN